MKTLEERALAAAKDAGIASNGFADTLEVIRLSARTLYGSQPTRWSTTIYNVREISIPMDETVRSTIALPKPNGRITIDLSGVNGFAFYVECKVQAPEPGMGVRWDAMMDDSGPVNGIATLDPASGTYYFATPRAGNREPAHVTVDGMLATAPEMSVLIVHQIELFGFVPA